ncbi:MAG: mechanosensitive ion channel family protein [Alphaproteobacteria bacterium]
MASIAATGAVARALVLAGVVAGAMAGVVLASAGGAVAQREREASWEGQWHSFWRDGQALMRLEQEGERVTGTYRPGNGEIEGVVDGARLTGTWSQDGGSGGFSFALAPDGQSFAGRFDNGEYWNGERVDPESFRPTPFIRSDSPRAALRTIVVAGNAAGEGDSGASLVYEPLLIYAGPGSAAEERQARWTLLYRLLDMSTFRIGDLPAEVDTDEVVVEIGPAGSDFTFPITLRRQSDGRWRLVVPPEDELKATKAALLDALGHEDYAAYVFARRESPREAMRDFLEGVQTWEADGMERALSALDLSGIPPALESINAPLYADYLRQIVDRLGYVIWQEIPNNPEQVTSYVHYAHAEGEIAIGPTRDAEGNVDWRFTRATIAAAPAIFEAIQELPIAPGLAEPEAFTPYFTLRESVKEVSPALLERVWLLPHWQWIALALAAVAALVLAYLVGLVVNLAWRLLPAPATGEGDAAAADARGSGLVTAVRLIVLGAVVYLAVGRIGLRSDVLGVLATGAALVVLVGAVAALYRLAGIVGGAFYRRATLTSGYLDEIVTSLATGLVKIVIIVGGIIMAADIVGLPYEGVIAGLGVGGFALAIAARDTVSNFFGAAVLLAERPFKRGDFIEVDGRYAVVEDVGLRTSQLRLFDDALMVIPNAKVADGTVINYGRRRKRQLLLTVSLTYDTPRERMDAFVAGLKDLLAAFPRADREYYVGLARLAEWSIDIDLWCYVWVRSYGEQVEAQHRLIGDIVELAGRVGVDFAFPTRTVHMGGPLAPADAAGEGRSADAAAMAGGTAVSR